MSAKLYNGQIADTAVAGDDLVLVAVPGLGVAHARMYGPMPFDTHVGDNYPTKGDDCLIAVDTNGPPWILRWQES